MAFVPTETLRRWIARVEAALPRLAEEMSQRLDDEAPSPSQMPGPAPGGGRGEGEGRGGLSPLPGALGGGAPHHHGPAGARGTATPAPHEAAGPAPRYLPTGRLLGAGGQAAVLEARDERLERTVALKRGAFAGTLAEARRTAPLFHPGLLPVLDFVPGGVAGEQGALVTPVAPEGTLAKRLAARRGRPWRSRDDPELRLLLRHWRRLVETAGFLHDHEVVHADVKPANVLLGAHGEVFLHDLGIAAPLRLQLEPDGLFCGTAGWVPSPPHPGADHHHPARDTWQLAALLACITHSTEQPAHTPLAAQAWHPRHDDATRLGATIVAQSGAPLPGEDPTFATVRRPPSGEDPTFAPTVAAAAEPAAAPPGAPGDEPAAPPGASEDGPAAPPSPASARPGWLAELDTIALRLAADERGDPRVVLPALDAWEAGGDVPGHPYGRLERVGRSLRRHPTRLAVAGGLGLALLVLTAAAWRAGLLGAERDRELRRRLLQSSLELVTRGDDPVPVEVLARELLGRAPDPDIRGALVVASSRARPTLIETRRYAPEGPEPVGWVAVGPDGAQPSVDDRFLYGWSPDGRTQALWEDGTVEVRGPAGTWRVDGLWRDPIVPLPQDDGSLVGGSRGELLLYRDGQPPERLVASTAVGFARSQGGPYLALSSEYGDLGVFDLRSRRWVANATGDRAVVTAVSPNGRYAAFATPPEGDSQHEVHLWDLARNTWTHLAGHQTAVRAALFLDDRRLVSVDLEGGVRLWADGQLVAAWRAPRPPRFMPLRATGDLVQLADNAGLLRTWSVAGLEPERVARDEAPQRSISFDVEGHPWTVGDPGQLTHWRPDGPVRDELAGSHGVAVAVRPDGTVACASSPGHLWLRPPQGAARALELPPTEGTTAPHVNTLAWSPDGQTLAIGMYLGARSLYTPATGQLWSAPVPGDCGSVLGVAWRPSGREVVFSQISGCLVRQPVGGGPAQVDRLPYKGLGEVTLDPTGRFAVMGSRESRVVFVWDLDTQQEVRHMAVGDDWANVVHWAGDRLVACTAGGELYTWDTRTWALETHFRAHRGNCSSARIGPDGAVWSTGGDGRVARWPQVPGFDI